VEIWAVDWLMLTLDDHCDRQNFRARQNVILELGFFWGRLGHERVCCLSMGEMQLPSDMHRIVLIRFKETIEEVYHQIEIELKNTGYNV
jgi:predicted nucleotide-binding protein